MADHIEGRAGPDQELTDLVWLPLSKADKLEMPRITRMVLADLQARIEGGMSPLAPVPHYSERRGAWQRELL